MPNSVIYRVWNIKSNVNIHLQDLHSSDNYFVTPFINKLWNNLKHQSMKLKSVLCCWHSLSLYIYILKTDTSAFYTANNCVHLKNSQKKNVENSITVFFFIDSSYYLLLQFLKWYLIQVQIDASPIATYINTKQ